VIEMKNRYYGIIIFAFVIVIAGLYINTYWNTYSKDTVTQVTYYDCYRVTAPFGVFVVEGEGEIAGSFIAFYGSSEFELREEYVIKYFDGNELKTKIFDAEKTPLIVDGTFKFEVVKIEDGHYKVGIDEPIRFYQFSQGYPKYVYKIHIPYLPNVPQTTDDWIK